MAPNHELLRSIPRLGTPSRHHVATATTLWTTRRIDVDERVSIPSLAAVAYVAGDSRTQPVDNKTSSHQGEQHVIHNPQALLLPLLI